MDKGPGSAQPVQNPDMVEKLDYCTLPVNFGAGTKGQSFGNPEKFRK